jgi:hypothetical protein
LTCFYETQNPLSKHRKEMTLFSNVHK